MEWNAIRAALSRTVYPFPVTAAEEARARWDELAPNFLAELERVADGGSTLIDDIAGEWDGLFSFAAFLAAEKRDVRAYAPLVRAGHCPSERANELFGDDVGEVYGRLLASVCDGDLTPLRKLAEDREAGLWCRFAALHAQVVRVVEGDADRDEVLNYIGALCECEAAWLRQAGTDADDDTAEFLTWAADTSCELGPAPLLEAIRGWFAEGLINPTVTGLTWFEKEAAKSVEECLAAAAADDSNRYLRDALGEIGSWYCYEKPAPARVHAQRPQPAATPVRAVPKKVGRNDPCPCGSGKKYKKCCGNEGSAVAAGGGSGASKDGAISRAIEWLTSRHGKAVKTAMINMLHDDLDIAEQAALREVADEDWNAMQVNAMEWLMTEGSIAVKGVQRNVAELLLGSGGPAFTPGQRSWLEQLRHQPLRLYDITDVLPGVGMRLCDALETDAAPLMVYEKSGSLNARMGNLIGLRIVEVDGHLELSGAAYPFSRLMNPAVLAELRAATEPSATHGEPLPQVLSGIIRRNWIAQYARPMPMPTIIDSHSGDPVLLINDHYRVTDWDALTAALATQPDIEGDRASGWARLHECDDGLTRQSISINHGKSTDQIEVFYKTQNFADQGRPWFEALAGASVEFADRVLSDPKGLMKNMTPNKAGKPSDGMSDLPSDVIANLIEQAMRRTYANWCDDPIPALSNQTPRAAVKTPAGLERVKGLLRSYAADEKEQAAQQGRREISFDFLWDALGLRPVAGS